MASGQNYERTKLRDYERAKLRKSRNTSFVVWFSGLLAFVSIRAVRSYVFAFQPFSRLFANFVVSSYRSYGVAFRLFVFFVFSSIRILGVSLFAFFSCLFASSVVSSIRSNGVAFRLFVFFVFSSIRILGVSLFAFFSCLFANFVVSSFRIYGVALRLFVFFVFSYSRLFVFSTTRHRSSTRVLQLQSGSSRSGGSDSKASERFPAGQAIHRPLQGRRPGSSSGNNR